MKFKVAVLALAAVTLVLQASSAPVQAQSTSSQSTKVTNNSNSMRISPVRSDLALDPGGSKTITVYAQNMSTKVVQAKAIVSDFIASLDEDGAPQVILQEDEYAKSHSLKRLAVTEPSIVSLTPGQRVPVTVKVSVPKNALAGGYYGAVRFIPVANLTTGDDTGVSISTNVGSLILLRVNGDIIEKANLESFEVRQKNVAGTFFKTPDDLTAVVRFKGGGNVQVAPFGKVRLLKSGKVIEEKEINNLDPKGNVLPDSVRRFAVDITKVGTFGKYTLEGNFGYGTGGELIASKVTFWVVPVTYMVGAAAALIIIVLLVVFIPRMLRSYKRRIISRAGRRY